MTKSERKAENIAGKVKADENGGSRLLFWGGKARPQLLLVLLAFVLTLVIVPKGGFAPAHYQPGDIASRDVKAPRDMLVPDPVLTDKKRIEAEQSIMPLYDYDPGVGQDVSERLKQVFDLFQPPADEATVVQPVEELRRRHEQGIITSIEFIKFLLKIASDVVTAEREIEPEIEVAPEEQGIAALTELFQEIQNGDTPKMVERIVNDIDEIVRVVRFPGWQNTSKGQREVKMALRRTLAKYQLHKDNDLFEKAYGYIEKYF